MTFANTLIALLAQARPPVPTPAASSATAAAAHLRVPSLIERIGVGPDLARWIEWSILLALTMLVTMLALRLVPTVEKLVLRFAVKAPKETRATQSVIELQARIETLTRVVGSLVRALVLSIASVTVLGELGLEIKPLLAGAGIAGVAIGFGAQAVIKDFFAGFFILLEDQYDVGDTVTIGAVTGTVERMTLRITQLRDAQGTAYFIPNSAISQVGNKTHYWAKATVDVAFQYSVSVNDARAALEDACKRAENARHAEVMRDVGEVDVKVDGPNELEWGGTKWSMSLKVPANVATQIKRVLVDALHEALRERGFEPDEQGRLRVKKDTK